MGPALAVAAPHTMQNAMIRQAQQQVAAHNQLLMPRLTPIQQSAANFGGMPPLVSPDAASSMMYLEHFPTVIPQHPLYTQPPSMDQACMQFAY